MITMRELQSGVIALLGKAGFSTEEYDVLFERNEVPSGELPGEDFLSETGEVFADGEEIAQEDGGNLVLPKSYFHVTFNEKRRTVDRVYCDRSISVYVEFFPQPDDLDDIDDGVLWEAADNLNNALYPIFEVADRHLTVLDISYRIFGDALHFRFELEFTDYKPLPDEYDKMKRLAARFSRKNIKFEFDAEEE